MIAAQSCSFVCFGEVDTPATPAKLTYTVTFAKLIAYSSSSNPFLLCKLSKLFEQTIKLPKSNHFIACPSTFSYSKHLNNSRVMNK